MLILNLRESLAMFHTGIASSLALRAAEELDFETLEWFSFIIAIFSILLCAITLSSYRTTRSRRLLLVAVAFALFGVNALLSNYDVLVLNISPLEVAVASAVMSLIILVLFFAALVLKR